MSENKVIQIRTKNGTQNVNVDLNQDFDYLEVLSLKILQKDAYRLFCSEYGVLVGKVLANGGFPIQNAKLSIFIPLDVEDSSNTEVTDIYPFTSPQGTLPSGKRYNLLPRDQQYNTPVLHTPVGTFPSKYDIMTNQTLKYVHEKYYKYTTTTNANGDYMFFGVPSGTHIIHMDIDLSDIGTNSITPADLINLGYSPYLFDSSTKFRNSNDLDQLAQIVGQNQTTYISPFWGDPDQCNFGITRLDFNTSRFVYPKGYLIGSVYTDANHQLPNSFIPRSCWQQNQNSASSPDGYKYGVSRIVSATTLRSPKEVAENGETFGHKGIIEAVRINEDTREPEYVGKWETDTEGNFIIPLPLNRGKKKWDEDEQSWVPSKDDGFFTYADYRFKFYFEGQGDDGPGNSVEYQFDGYTEIETTVDEDGNALITYDHTFSDISKTNRGVLFSPNPYLWSSQGGDGNMYSFYAKPIWESENSYKYNMEDQFGNQIDIFQNYARIRLGGYYSTEQFFKLKADFDSAVKGYDTYGLAQGHEGKWYNGTTDGIYGNCDDCLDGTPEFQYWSNGTNPWIISRAYIPPNEGKNQFPINYLFTAPYLMKAPTKQPVLTEVNITLNGGFVSHYINEPKVEAVFGPAFGETETNEPDDYIYSPSPNWTSNAGGFYCGNVTGNCLDSTPCGDCCDNATGANGGTVVDWGSGINMTGDKNDVFSDINYDQCAGGSNTYGDACINTNTFTNGSYNSSFNEDTGPYDYNFQTPGSDDWSDVQVVDPNAGLNGNAGYGGFVAPRAGLYKLKARVAYCGAADCYWASVGFSICDTTAVNCGNNNNWSYSGRTTVMGKTPAAREDPDWLDFNSGEAYPWNNTKFNKGTGLSGTDRSNGWMTWEIPMKEGQAIKLHIRASASDNASYWDANANNSSDLVIIHWAYGSPDAYSTHLQVTGFESFNQKSETTNRDTKQGIVGSLYFPQYYLGADENQSCSKANGDFIYHPEPSMDGRQHSWKYYSLLATGSWTEGGNYNETLVEAWGNDPKGGLPIPNSKYYNVNTIGGTKIVELTKDKPDFRNGPNQWSTIDALFPETSADMSMIGFDLNDKDYEDFSTNSSSPGEGRLFLQKKNFAPYDNLGFRNSQQFPRELGAANYNNTIGNTNLIPGWADWWNEWGANEFQYPVQAPYYYIQNNMSESNTHYFRNSPTNLSESAEWKPWATQMPPLWYDNNTFWWSNIFPVEHIGIGSALNSPSTPPDGAVTTPWMLGSTYDVQRGGDTPVVDGYPKRKYYFFGLRPNRTPIKRIKDILGS